MKDARQCQAAEPGADNRNWSIHVAPFMVGIRKDLWNVIP
jgi:hypothetical protein